MNAPIVAAPTLRIRDLRLGFRSYSGTIDVLHGISLHIARGERVALVGESGSGKSVTARIVLGLLQSLRSARIAGLLEFEGRDLDRLPERERHALRGTRMSMIFQDPTSSLNPVYPIMTQFHEVLRRAAPDMRLEEARLRAAKALDDVAIPEPDRVLDSYPFQLSGGMNQRVMIAMALVNEPSLLIADEPGTALDVTVQAQTLGLMRGLVEKHNTAVLFISHNLGVVREFADRVYVIYKGRIVEQGTAAGLFEEPRHPYTRALMRAVPRITGGGIPDIEDASEDYFAPIEIHRGCEEPEVAG
jgi:peptide/nickel transport system ATP-binding protein